MVSVFTVSVFTAIFWRAQPWRIPGADCIMLLILQGLSRVYISTYPQHLCSSNTSVTPGPRRVELTPLGSHTNLGCDIEETISGTFTLDKESVDGGRSPTRKSPLSTSRTSNVSQNNTSIVTINKDAQTEGELILYDHLSITTACL